MSFKISTARSMLPDVHADLEDHQHLVQGLIRPSTRAFQIRVIGGNFTSPVLKSMYGA